MGGSPLWKWAARGTKWAVATTAVLALLLRRDAETVHILLGSAAAGLAAPLLKRVCSAVARSTTGFAADRPVSSASPDPGMPSSHALLLSYFTTYLCGWMYPRWIASLAIIVAAVALSTARVRAGEHTVAQVAVGGALGTAYGGWWWRSRAAWLPWVETHLTEYRTAKVSAIAILGIVTLCFNPGKLWWRRAKQE